MAEYLEIDNTITLLNTCRADVIKRLEQVAGELDRQTIDVHAAKISFAGIGVVGSAVTIGGLILAPFTAGLSSVVSIVGIGIATAATVGTIGTRVTDSIALNRRTRRAKEAIETYNMAVKRLEEVVNELDEVTKHDMKAVMDAIESNIQNVSTLASFSSEFVQIAKHLSKVLKNGEGVSLANTLGRELLEGPKQLIKSMKPKMIASSARGSAKTLARVPVLRILGTSFCVLAIAFDVHTIVTSSIAIHNQKGSEVAAKLREIIKGIAVELNR